MAEPYGFGIIEKPMRGDAPPMTRPIRRSTKTFAVGSALVALLLASGALAADEPLPLDQANAAIAQAKKLIDGAPVGNKEAEEHKKKAGELLIRAQSEIFKAKTAK